MLSALVSLGKSEGIVVFSHFIALNAAFFSDRRDQVVTFRPDNCSVVCLEQW